MTDAENREIVQKFIAGLRNGDANLLKSVVTDDFVRSLPGKSLMSGEAGGLDSTLPVTRAQFIRCESGPYKNLAPRATMWS